MAPLLALTLGGPLACPAHADASPSDPTEIVAADSLISVSGIQLTSAVRRHFRVEIAGATTVETVTYRGPMGSGRVSYLATPSTRGQAWNIRDPDLVIESLARQVAPDGVKIQSGDTTEIEGGHARYPMRYFQLLSPNHSAQNCFAFGVGVGWAASEFRGNTEQIYGFHCLQPGLPVQPFILPEYFEGIVVRPLAARRR